MSNAYPVKANAVQIFGREPAFWTALIEAVLSACLAAGGSGLTSKRIALIMAVVTAAFGVYSAYVTKDSMLAVGVGLAKAVLALLVGYGLKLSADQVSTVIAIVTIVLGAYHRSQTSPLVTPGFRNDADAPILTSA